MKLALRLTFWLVVMGGILAVAIDLAPARPLLPGARAAMAANVDIVLNGDPDDNVALTFNGPGCPQAMASGDTCVATVSITNDASALAIDYTTSVAVTAGAECDAGHPGDEFTASVGNFVDTTDNTGPDDTQHMPAGTPDSEQFDVAVTLSAAAGNSCQNASATVLLTVDATEDTVDPDNPTDSHSGIHDAKVEKLDTGGKDIGLGGDGRTDRDVKFHCQNKSEHSDIIRCVLEISGLPAGCNATNRGADDKFGTGDDVVVTSPGGLLVDDTSVYPKHDSKMNFDFKMRIQCNPIPSNAPITIRGVADHNADDYPSADDDDTAPANNVRTNFHVLKR